MTSSSFVPSALTHRTTLPGTTISDVPGAPIVTGVTVRRPATRLACQATPAELRDVL
jgi:hypothetical protein